jgi:hypothetical protein
VKVLGRGHTEFTEVPDQPTAPTLPAGAPIARGSEAPAGTQATADHSAPRADSTSAPVTLITSDATLPGPTIVSFSLTNAPVLLGPSAVTEIQLPAVMRGDLGGSNDTGGGGGIERGSDTLASLALDGPNYADHGWFIVPSAGNDPGYVEASAGADGDVAWGFADAGYASDWFFA